LVGDHAEASVGVVVDARLASVPASLRRAFYDDCMQIDGAVVYVTGASRGIGEVTAELLHSRGATVGLLARSQDDLTVVAKRLGDRVAVESVDITDPSGVGAAFSSLAAAIGPADVLVNNAGGGAYASVIEEDPGLFERLMRVNYLGTVYATRAVLPSMIGRRCGHIVNVASIAGRVGAPFEAAYSASKFAVVGFSESLAAEMAQLGIAVSLVNPGPVATHFTEARGVPFQREVPRPLRAENVAAAIGRAIERDVFEQTMPR
jgi:short-subunit dehydrogenase